MSLTFLGHCAFKFDLAELSIYIDPYIQEPIDSRRLAKGDVVLLTHGHFDHGVLASARLWETWKCKFVAPRKLVAWMRRKYRKVIPPEYILPLDHGESLQIGDLKITAVPALHPTTRLGKTMIALFARSSAPGAPVNGYHFGGYYHSGDTIYTPAIAAALKDVEIHTACLPIGGKYKVATPQEALRIAEEIRARRVVPMHFQPLVEQVPQKYQPSHLTKLARSTNSPVAVCPLAIGEVLDDSLERR